MPTIFQPPRAFIPNASGVKYPGAKAYFFETGTTTPKNSYTDFALSVAHAHPVVADANGDWPTIYLSNDARYRVTLKQSDGTLIYTQDDVGGPVLTQSEWGRIGYPKTAAETSAGVTPTNYAYEPGDIRRYGAVGDGSTDDSAAVSAAWSTGHPVYHPGGTCRLASAVTGAINNITVYGERGAEFLTDGNIGFSVSGDNPRFTGIRFRSAQAASATPDSFIYVTNGSGLQVDNCIIGRGLIQCRSTASTPETRCTIVDNSFEGDYTGSSGADITNIIDVRGVTDVTISRNKFTCQEWYRVAKVSSATGDTSPVDTGRSKRVIFTNNTLNVSATGGQQCVDFFASTEEIIVADNIFVVSGAMTAVVHAKSDGGTDKGPYVNNIQVTGNVFKLGSGVTSPIFLSGAWGLSEFVVKQKAVVAGNIIEEAGTTTAASITVKGFNLATIVNNQREAPSVAFSRFIEIDNNQISVVTGNETTFGCINVRGNGSSPNGNSYGNQPESIIIANNVIDDFTMQGAVLLESISSCEEMTIAHNHFRNQTDSSTINGSITTSGTVAITNLKVFGNTANFANTAKHIPNGTPTVTTYLSRDNTWDAAVIAVASGSTITLPLYGDTFSITGTTTITSIVAATTGRKVTLIFAGILTLTDGSNLKLAGNFVTTADDVITLVSDGTNWVEQSRSVN